jgi:Plasmid pRiA4b ORF-3-like protein
MTATIYRIKITLEHVKPPVWRRIEVPGDITLARLHAVIQRVMGWDDYHMWSFQVGKTEYQTGSGETFDFAGGPRPRSPAGTTLAQATEGRLISFRYWYDFGDDWFHAIKVERVANPEPGAVYPRCLEGARACPPEDCGGPWGYQNFLEAVMNSKHPEHEEMLEWIGGEWDAEAFDLDAMNKAIKPRQRKAAKTAKK